MAGLLNHLLISGLRKFKNRKTLDNNDLNQVGVQRFFSENKGLVRALSFAGS